MLSFWFPSGSSAVKAGNWSTFLFGGVVPAFRNCTAADLPATEMWCWCSQMGVGLHKTGSRESITYWYWCVGEDIGDSALVNGFVEQRALGYRTKENVLVSCKGLSNKVVVSWCADVWFTSSIYSESRVLPRRWENAVLLKSMFHSHLLLMRWGNTNILLVLSSRGGSVSCYVGKKIPHQRTGPSGRISPWSEGSSVFLSLNAMPFTNKKAMQFITMVTGLPTLSMCQQTRFRLVYLGQSSRALSK